MTSTKKIIWHKVLENKNELPEGRVMTVTAGHTQIALSHFEGALCALSNRCPHQGGPLGEGAIENGWLRCPWHGWDYHPCSGKPPGGYDDGLPVYRVEERADGIYVGLEEEPPRGRTVSDLMVETMTNWGVDTVFGMVGHSNLGLADALRRAEEKGRLKFIAIRHEGAGAFAASAYGKLSGKPAACFAIAGPGATNMFTGMWDAHVDRAPLLALSGQVATQVVGTGNFQEVDLVQAFSSVAAFNHRVQKDSRHAELMSLAIKHALLGRNVSHLTFPDEVQTVAVEEHSRAGSPRGRLTTQTIAPPEEALNRAVELIKKAERPVIIAGYGARYSMSAVIRLAERLNAPVLTTFKGKGLISDNHPLGCGVLGRSGTPVASWFMNESDLLIVFGASFSNHTGITPKKPIIQVDFDPLALGKFHPVECAVWGEIGVTVAAISGALKGSLPAKDRRPEIEKRRAIWMEEKRRRLGDDRGRGVSSIAVFDSMNRLVEKDAVITVDVGNNAYSFGRYFETRGQSILMSGYLGSIGFALPAALGAWAAAPERQIVSVSGDGGFMQYMAEMATAVKYHIPLKHILLNNNELGKISKEQRAGHFEVWKTALHNPGFAVYAENCGALGIRVTKREDLEGAMKKVLSHRGPALLEVMTDVNLL